MSLNMEQCHSASWMIRWCRQLCIAPNFYLYLLSNGIVYIYPARVTDRRQLVDDAVASTFPCNQRESLIRLHLFWRISTTTFARKPFSWALQTRHCKVDFSYAQQFHFLYLFGNIFGTANERRQTINIVNKNYMLSVNNCGGWRLIHIYWQMDCRWIWWDHVEIAHIWGVLCVFRQFPPWLDLN